MGEVSTVKAFKLALCCGRFQNFQQGHLQNLVRASMMAEKVLVLVGSAQVEGTVRNPFPVDLRMKIVEACLQDAGLTNVTVAPLKDLSSENDISPEWGKFLIAEALSHGLGMPDVIVHGDDGRKNDPVLWFDEKDRMNFHFMMAPRNSDSVSGTKLRELMAKDVKEEWEQNVPFAEIQYYDDMRQILLSNLYYAQIAEDYTKQRSLKDA